MKHTTTITHSLLATHANLLPENTQFCSTDSISKHDASYPEHRGSCHSDVSPELNGSEHNPYFRVGLAECPVAVLSVGSEARKILQTSFCAQVVAVFKSSFYVQNEQGIFCVGVASLGRGPLQIQLASDSDSLFNKLVSGGALAFHNEQAALLSDYTGLVTCTDNVSHEPARYFSERTLQMLDRFKPPSAAGFGWLVSEHSVEHASVCCARAMSGRAMSGYESLDTIDRGLRQQCYPALRLLDSWLVSELSSTAEQRHAAAGSSSEQVSKTEQQTTAKPPQDIRTLVGAGLGLTPSGDDLLAGVLLMLHRTRYGDQAQALWQMLEPSLVQRTNVISGAHLRMAAQAQCAEPMLRVLDQLTASETPDARGASNINNDSHLTARLVCATVSSIGSLSGWDTLAGMSLVMRALLQHNVSN